MEVTCYNCQTKITLDTRETIARNEECPNCYASIRSCRMCSFYDTTTYNECRETSADRILEKEKSNFCDYYQLGNGDVYKDKKDDLLSAADALFKK